MRIINIIIQNSLQMRIYDVQYQIISIEQNQYIKKHMTSFQSRKLFPLKLPENFHGVAPKKLSLVQSVKSKIGQRPMGNPEQLFSNKKVTTWQKKKFDKDVIHQRRQMVVHPAKLSSENPDWLKTTYDYFRRDAAIPRKRQTRAQWESYDVFGRDRAITYASNDMTKHRFSQNLQVSNKIGTQSRFWKSTVKEVTGKVGSLDVRDMSVRRPQMKVGKTDFIDTYTPF